MRRATRNPALYRVKLTAAEQDIVGEFDNDVWLAEVGLRPEGGGVFSGDERALRLLRGAFLDRADPLDDWGLSAAQRRTARKAALKVQAALGATSRNGKRVSRNPAKWKHTPLPSSFLRRFPGAHTVTFGDKVTVMYAQDDDGAWLALVEFGGYDYDPELHLRRYRSSAEVDALVERLRAAVQSGSRLWDAVYPKVGSDVTGGGVRSNRRSQEITMKRTSRKPKRTSRNPGIDTKLYSVIDRMTGFERRHLTKEQAKLTLDAHEERCSRYGWRSEARVYYRDGTDVTREFRGGSMSTNKKRTSRNPRSSGYYSVHVPWSPKPTSWHPTERTGPFSVLTRGAFPTEAAAHAWAQAHLRGQPYSVVFHGLAPNARLGSRPGPDEHALRTIVEESYGVNAIQADPIVVEWAFDDMVETHGLEVAKSALDALNERRIRLGLIGVYPRAYLLRNSRLTEAQRSKLPASAFVFPGRRAFPLESEAAAYDAIRMLRLGRVKSAADFKAVTDAVRAKYPAVWKKYGATLSWPKTKAAKALGSKHRAATVAKKKRTSRVAANI